MEHESRFHEKFVVLFCNTGKEKDETLDFVDRVDREWGVGIVWLEYTRVKAASVDLTILPPRFMATVIDQARRGEDTHWFKVVNYATAHRNGTPNGPFDQLLSWANVLPNIQNRMCSVQLKIRTMNRYMFSKQIYCWQDNIGIRADEAHRKLEIEANCPSYIRPAFPLIDLARTEQDILDFWKKQPFDLQLQPYRGNCDLCFLKAKHKRVRIAKEEPQSLEWWKEQEQRFALKSHITGDGKFFRRGEPYTLIEALTKQEDLFPPASDDIPCGCADRGYVLAESDEL
jgi:3'-phosphoadenosine 5'-phosphosulfate sulfotransferase (PAPS reductase)/FAD synthetase